MVSYGGVATTFTPTGLTGATAATRYVGGTTSGAPVTGTFAVGDFIIDETGVLWICTAAGSPGTWTALVTTANTAQTINGAKTFIEQLAIYDTNAGAAGIVTIAGGGDGANLSQFELSDTGSSHQWALSHRETSHALLLYNYNGSSYTNVLTCTEAGNVACLHNTLDDGSGNMTVAGLCAQAGGTDTSATATASSPSFSTGVAAQCSTTQDVMLYIAIQTAAALAVAIGPTSAAADVIMPSQTYALGLCTIRVPKGWWVKITGTIADLTITQVTC